MAGQRAATQFRLLSPGALQRRRGDGATAWTPRQPRDLRALPRTGETEGRGAILAASAGKSAKDRCPCASLTRNEPAMKKQRGRPKTLLTRRMSGETRDEICKIITYGSRAWRFIRIQQLLTERRHQLLKVEGKGLRPDYLSAGLAVLQVEPRAAGKKKRKVLARRSSQCQAIQPLPFDRDKLLKPLRDTLPLPAIGCRSRHVSALGGSGIVVARTIATA